MFAEVWDEVIGESLNEFKYMAEMAGLGLTMSLLQDNYQFKWSGYNDSMEQFIKETLQMLSTIDLSSKE